jgi:cell division protein FtsZ
MNTDTQDLHHSKAQKKIHIGRNLTKGQGTGMNPEIGREAAEETKAEIQEAIKGADMVFIACGMGGGTGTGAAPVVAQTARELGALTIAVVTKPFSFEGQQRLRIADQGIADLEKEVDAIIIVPNDRLLSITSKDTSFKEAFAMSDEILRQAVEGISELITTQGIINIDFADIKSVMQNAGSAFMGIGTAAGENRAEEAAYNAINSPLLDVAISGAKGVLFAIAAGDDLAMHEVNSIAKIVTESVDPDAKIIFGPIHDDQLKKGEIKVTVIATGFSSVQKKPQGGMQVPIQRSAPVQQQPEKREIRNEQPVEQMVRRAAPAPEKVVEEISDDDDDFSSAIPAFLRRAKK